MENKWLDSVVSSYRAYFGETAEIVFDVGTRDGDDAEFLREKLNATTVYAIDANPIAAERTRKSYPGFSVIETAISDFNGTTSFLQINSEDKNAAGTSSIDVSKAWREENIFKDISVEIKVPVVRLETLLEDFDLSNSIIGVMKIDIESYTYEALIGLGEKIRQVEVFHLETERKYDRPGHRNNSLVASHMRHYGFYLVDVSYEWGQGIQDQVWVNKALAKPGSTFQNEVSEK